MDFETFQPAVPLYDNSKPYQQIPFQYSIHLKEKKGGELKHFEFLAEPGEDPRIKFIEGITILNFILSFSGRLLLRVSTISVSSCDKLVVLVVWLLEEGLNVEALPAFAFAVLLIGSFLRSQVFKQKRPPDQYYRQYPPIRRRLSESNRRKGRSRE